MRHKNCNEGGYTNLQNLSMAIDGSSKLIYNAKYEFVANATTEFLMEFRGDPNQFHDQPEYIIGNEVHDVNQFIASIKQI